MVAAASSITCPLCATEFDGEERSACSACPIGQGCQLVCCPNCGYTMVNPAESKLAGWMTNRLQRGRGRRRHQRAGRSGERVEWASMVPLSQAPVKTDLIVQRMDLLPPRRRRQLRSYGLSPGSHLQALRHSPLTVILIDHTEIALETVLADSILVELPGD